MKIVIVGGVAGGASAAARLRRLDESAEILVFERGHYISYANCGLPYYAGGAIQDRERLFLMNPKKFKEALNVDVKVRHEVASIDRKAKMVSVKDLDSGAIFNQPYDTLILSPGAEPLRPPIPGIEDKAVMTLRNVPDIDAIVARMEDLSGAGDGAKDLPAISTRRAVVIGGGFIGLEMAENLRDRGMAVSLVEALDQVMSPIDFEMAQIVHRHLLEKGIDLHLKDGVSSFERTAASGPLMVNLSSGKKIGADMVILSIGVRPESGLAKAAGLDLAPNGAIVVDEGFRTSDPDIRAVGDAIEVYAPVSGKRLSIPLAGPANKQARLCADSIVKGEGSRKYRGTLGSGIAKVFDLTVASVGHSQKALAKFGIESAAVIVHGGSHAGYYPRSLQLSLKVIYSPKDGKILGAQAVGYDGVDKRIDVVSAIMGMGGSVHDLAAFEQAYAPPFSSAKDPVNMAGFVAENSIDGLSRPVMWTEVDALRAKGAFFLDVRSPEEFNLGSLPGAVNIAHTALRERLSEVPRGRPILINCAVGLRGYLAERVLRQNGFDDVGNLTGGYKTWSVATEALPAPARVDQGAGGAAERRYEERRDSGDAGRVAKNDDGTAHSTGGAVSCVDTLDARGLQCPGPIIQLKKKIDGVKTGDSIAVLATDPGFQRDVGAWCNLTGNRLVSISNEQGEIEAIVRKGGGMGMAEDGAGGTRVMQSGNGATYIVFSDDFDKALASFVLANGAAATGRDVTMFFTFWGLSVIKRKKKPHVVKDFMGRMFSLMLPGHAGKLALSKINMVGMGPAMMKMRMKSKMIDQLEVMMAQARASGVKLIACQMSMDIMGVKAEELLDGVEIGGVATYMEAASRSGVNLFI